MNTIIGEMVEIIELLIGGDNSNPFMAEIIFTDMPKTVQNKNFDQSFFSIFSFLLNKLNIQNKTEAPATLANNNAGGEI